RGQGGTRVATVPTPAQVSSITDPTSRAIFTQFAVPTSPTGSISNSAPNATKQASFSVRIDHQIRDNDRLTGRFGWADTEAVEESLTFIGTNLNNFGANVVSTPRQFALSETHIFTPKIVNEFRFAFGRTRPIFAINSSVPNGLRVAISGFSAFGQSDILPQGRTQN